MLPAHANPLYVCSGTPEDSLIVTDEGAQTVLDLHYVVSTHLFFKTSCTSTHDLPLCFFIQVRIYGDRQLASGIQQRSR